MTRDFRRATNRDDFWRVQILVRHPDYSDYETSTIVPAGGSKTLSVALEPPSIVTRWWFWGGVGVVVVAGTVVAVASVTEQSPDTGTIAPGQLSAPSSRGLTIVSF